MSVKYFCDRCSAEVTCPSDFSGVCGVQCCKACMAMLKEWLKPIKPIKPAIQQGHTYKVQGLQAQGLPDTWQPMMQVSPPPLTLGQRCAMINLCDYANTAAQRLRDLLGSNDTSIHLETHTRLALEALNEPRKAR